MGERPAPRPGVDPLFTDDDMEEILDLLAIEDATCSGCGQPRAESFNPDNADAYSTRKLKCFACEARGRRAAASEGEQHGIYYTVSLDD